MPKVDSSLLSVGHTPGPWYALDGAYKDDGPGAYSIGDHPTLEPSMVICSRHQWPERANEMLANARLIAAAPDLLAALREAEATLVMLGADVEPATGFVPTATLGLRIVRAAISKATGEVSQ